MPDLGRGSCTHPLILLSGMGADHRVFLPQLKAFANLIVPKWIEPQPRETLKGYAARMAARVDPLGPCFVGGASFGGMLAIEMAQYLDAKCCFLIGSVASPAEYPFWLTLLRGAPAAARVVPFGALTGASALLLASWPQSLSPYIRAFAEQIAQADPQFLRWATAAMLEWKAPQAPAVPICRIHGAKDRILPIRISKGIETLPDGGHLISLSHGPAVNRFLREKMAAHCD
jgi:pimeloyl-ACP methyl ester carboxylesterase